ncbi:hypothetical protein F750_1558 [Streptomyces sp. PAMC 26508]|nr:hypothetical protein F750_1558 [Streptomyces sp. PAMC 26508]
MVAGPRKDPLRAAPAAREALKPPERENRHNAQCERTRSRPGRPPRYL